MAERCVLSLDLGGTNVKSGIVLEGGDLTASHTQPTGKSLEADAVTARMAQIVSGLSEEAAGLGLSPLGVGLGVPGGIYRNRAVVSQSPNFPAWRDVHLKEPLEKASGMTVIMENDANVAALGEHWLGAGRGFSSMAAITLGTGVGGGIILDGKIWQGEYGMAGEIGHLTVVPDGLPCGCGNRGCLECYASAAGFVRIAERMIEQGKSPALAKIAQSSGTGLTPKEITEAAAAGDPGALEVLREVSGHLGVALAGVLNLLNLPLFVIGGGISPAVDLMADSILEEIRHRAFAIPASNVSIKRAELGNEAGLLGAARLVFQELGPV